MKNKLLILISILVAIFFAGGIFWYLNGSKTTTPATISESQAIQAIKNQFPEFKELHKTYSQKGFEIINISVENLNQVPFLQKIRKKYNFLLIHQI